jgi:Domain of unknown function (DUF4386)
MDEAISARDREGANYGLLQQERSVLRWGGLAGAGSGVLTVIGLALLFTIVPSSPTGSTAVVAQFPGERAAMLLEEAFYLTALVLLAVLFLALYRALRSHGLAGSLFGSGLGLLGVVLFVAGSVTVIALSQVANLSATSNASAQEHETAALVWQGVTGIFDQTDAMGTILVSVGFILLGVAMIHHPTFGKPLGTVTIGLGIAALVGTWVSIVQDAPFGGQALAFVIVTVVLPLMLGWRVYH